jgi:N-acetylglutamate synthase-like GNAT family acetyltransferase
MTEEVLRAWAFMRRADSAGETEEPAPLGTVIRDSRVPLRHDSNYLLVERVATVPEILAELSRLGLPVATARDESLVSGDTSGLVTHRGVLMVHRGPAQSPSRTAVEVDREVLEPVRRAFTLAQPWGSPELAEQLLAAKALIGERLTARFFASLADGEVVACTDLYLDPPDAQIEDVVTAPEHRRRGHAGAVVLAALAAARAAGAEFVFLVADAHDWPKDWYARLGFEPVGHYLRLHAPTGEP